MPVITVETRIRAPRERCFDLARDVTLHTASTAQTRERAVGGVTTGLLELGDAVTWEGTHFGVRQRLTSRITRYDRPNGFRDSMVRGAFRRFDHDHLFTQVDGVTTMTDVFDFDSPFGIVGRIADRLLLRKYMDRFLRARAEVLRQAAERL